MPANLPPNYFEEEKKLRQAKGPDEKIAIIERMLAIIPHHKGTDKLIGSLRSRISKLKIEMERHPQVHKKADSLYNIKKEGAGQVLFIGFPNSGKSSLISALSGQPLEVADYPFTTRVLQQRMMRYEDILVQLVDTPSIGEETQNMWFGNMLRHADTVCIVIGLTDAIEIEYELIMEELNPHLGDMDQRGTVLLLIVNKTDLTEHAPHLEDFENKIKDTMPIIPVSALKDVNIHPLKSDLYHSLNIVRVYSKMPGKKPDLETPFVLKKGSTIIDCAGRIHKDFVQKLKFAKLWREKLYEGMMVARDFTVEDGDIIEFHL